MQFDDLRLTEPLLRAVRSAGYRTPTPIQSEAIPIVLEGRDVLGCAQTGTGKTAAFALPVLQLLAKSNASNIQSAGKPSNHDTGGGNGHPKRPGNGHRNAQESKRHAGSSSPRRSRVLVLAPTRELAQQIHDSFKTYGKYTGLRQTVIFGGVKQNPQVRALRAGVDVIVATPGRLLDLMSQGFANVSGTEILILDEADRMLDMGFLPDIRRILKQVPSNRQTLLFSATMPSLIRKLADDILNEPVPIQVSRVSSPAPSVSHWVYHVEKAGKPTLLLRLLAQTPNKRALVFTRTKHGANKVVKQLLKGGLNAAALHGNKSQAARTRALADFRSAQTPVLVATDIAARGLDVENIARVVNYDVTHEPETYVHRIGRTGRAGAAGTAVSFCSVEERSDLRAIERLLGLKLQPAADPPQHESLPPVLTPKALPEPTRPAQSARSRPVQSPRNRSATPSSNRSGPGSSSQPSKRRSRPRRSRRSRGTQPGRPSAVAMA